MNKKPFSRDLEVIKYIQEMNISYFFKMYRLSLYARGVEIFQNLGLVFRKFVFLRHTSCKPRKFKSVTVVYPLFTYHESCKNLSISKFQWQWWTDKCFQFLLSVFYFYLIFCVCWRHLV